MKQQSIEKRPPAATGDYLARFGAGKYKVASGAGASDQRRDLFVSVAELLHGYVAILSFRELAGHLRLLSAAWQSQPTGYLQNNARALRRLVGGKPTPQMFHGFELRGDQWINDQLVQLAAYTSDKDDKDDRRPKRLMSPRLRFSVLSRDGHRCVYCGRGASQVELQVDHVVPVAKGGKCEPENLVAACVDCNAGKSDRIFSRVTQAEQ